MKILLFLASIGGIVLLFHSKDEHKSNSSYKSEGETRYRKPSTIILKKTPLENKSKINGKKQVDRFNLTTIERLKKCWQKDCHEFSSSDPKAYYFNLGKKMAAEIANLKIETLQKKGAIEELLELYKIENAFIREQILDLFQKLPPNERIKEVLTNSLDHNFEAKIVYQTLIELLIKYPGDKEVNHKIQQLILSGPHFAKIYFLQRLSPVITSLSFSFFETLLPKIPSHSQEYQLLKFALNEYTRRLEGA